MQIENTKNENLKSYVTNPIVNAEGSIILINKIYLKEMFNSSAQCIDRMTMYFIKLIYKVTYLNPNL